MYAIIHHCIHYSLDRSFVYGVSRLQNFFIFQQQTNSKDATFYTSPFDFNQFPFHWTLMSIQFNTSSRNLQ